VIFEVNLCPKPYVRMTRRGKWVKKDAQEYLTRQRRIRRALHSIMAREGWSLIRSGQPLAVRIDLVHSHGFHGRDLDNEAKAILDAAQGVVFENDRWVDDLFLTRKRDVVGCGFILNVERLEHEREND